MTTFALPLAYVTAVFIAIVCLVRICLCIYGKGTDLPHSTSLWQEFNIEKLQIVEAEKRKIRQEYERKENQLDIKKKMYGKSIISKAFCLTSIFSFMCAVIIKSINGTLQQKLLDAAKCFSFKSSSSTR